MLRRLDEAQGDFSIMMRVLMVILWGIVFYVGGCFVVGFVAGAIAGANNPQNASVAGAQAGADAVTAWRAYVWAIAIALSAIGMYLGFLPGTRARRMNDK